MSDLENTYFIPVIGWHEPVISYGNGSYVYGNDGKAYLDLNSGQFCTVLGHSDPELAKRLEQNAGRIAHTNTGMLCEEAIKAAENLHRISGELDGYSIFLSTGAEAVEFCIRYAKFLKNKQGIVCFDKGYHGLTLGAQSITYGGVYARPEVDGIYPVPVPDTFADNAAVQQAVEIFEKTLKNHCDEIAAVVMEPIVSVGGMIIPGAEYFKEIRRLCDQYDVMLIFDECQTGFARTGEWFAYQTLECLPDMIACAKAVGLGYPVSIAMMAGKYVTKEGFKMTHYSSHQNDGFAAAIINYGIECVENEKLLTAIKEKGQYFLEKLQNLCNDDGVGLCKARGCGLMLGADLYVPGLDNYRGYYAELSKRAVEKGVIIQGTNGGRTLRFLPDYRIRYEDIDFCIEVLKDIL
ncbi:MAG: aspartate aminotransferase family protein [Clostridia bacterium]|nr:aspartate aminotransferase family protein [Clostridia bacterium]